MCDLNGVVVHAIVRAPNCRQKVSPRFGGAEIERRTHDHFAGIDDSIPGALRDNLISGFVSRYKDLVAPSLAESRQRHRKLYDRGGQRHLLQSVDTIVLSSHRSGIKEIDICFHRLCRGHLDGC